MKVLNLYACLGGNRLLWDNCEVTAVELDTELARMYQERFPDDKVVVGDAHQYLLDHYKEFDFIWSSPPCPTHSRARYWGSKGGQCNVKYPDLKLYEEIILLSKYYNGIYVVENVVPFYKPLIPGQKIGKHIFWSNFIITNLAQAKSAHYEKQKEIEEFHKIDLSGYKGIQSKKKIARNMVHYDTGLHIFNLSRGIYQSNLSEQQKLKL